MKRGMKILASVVLSLTIILSLNLIVLAVDTQAEIANSGPVLDLSIPNQTWPANQSLLEAFDLDNYFSDANGDTLTYTYTSLENISITIDSDNLVSFFPDIGFIGVRTVFFNASDGSETADSNEVYLNVGYDLEAPQWISQTKNKVTIYQNSFVNFSATWTDNAGLGNFIFSINEGGGWSNSSAVNMSGLSNTSRTRFQISAPGGTNVSWRFYAYDLIDNINATPISYFTVASLPTTSAESDETNEDGEGEDGESSESSSSSSSSSDSSISKNFTLDWAYLLITVNPGDSLTKILKITNIGSVNISFNIYEQNLHNFLSISEDIFSLSPGESKQLTFDFTIPGYFPSEQYFGYIVVNSSVGLKKIPIILDLKIKKSDLEINLDILDKYKIVSPGKIVMANLTLNFLSEAAKQESVLYYAIKDINGNLVEAKEEVLPASDSYSLIKELVVPQGANRGNYIFYARISNQEKVDISSEIFEVGSKIKLAAFFKYGSYLIILFLLSSIILLLVFRYNQKKEKARILRLYLLLNEMKTLIKENKVDDALKLYLKIKFEYKDKVPGGLVNDKEKLKEEINKLSEKMKQEKIEPTPITPKEASTLETSEKKEVSEKKEEITNEEK